ncbi:MAG TPA: hypothetical protein PK074_11555 [Spirochaetales bacterium]|nr:hypothetical protein [Spirochaetales bacterium]
MDYTEPMYDDVELELYKHSERILLVKALREYADELCDVIAELRSEVNRLDYQYKKSQHFDMSKYQSPYLRLNEDINRSFEDYPAYEEFKSAFEDNDSDDVSI